VFDATQEALPADREAVRLLRATKKPVIYVANKADWPGRAREAMSLHELGIDSLLPISAAHGLGVGELEETLAAALPEPREATDEGLAEDTPRVDRQQRREELPVEQQVVPHVGRPPSCDSWRSAPWRLRSSFWRGRFIRPATNSITPLRKSLRLRGATQGVRHGVAPHLTTVVENAAGLREFAGCLVRPD
jgi:hypothetical protein